MWERGRWRDLERSWETDLENENVCVRDVEDAEWGVYVHIYACTIGKLVVYIHKERRSVHVSVKDSHIDDNQYISGFKYLNKRS